MKRNLSILVGLMLLVALVCTLAACGPKEPEHTHAYTEAITTPATCEAKGVKTFTCSCNDSYTEEIAAKGHTSVDADLVPVGCTTNGTTAGTKCGDCGVVLSGCVSIPATGHKYTNHRCEYCKSWAEGVTLTTYTFDASTMEATTFNGVDGDKIKVGTDGFLTIITKESTKIEATKDVEYEDGYAPTMRLSLGGKVNWTNQKNPDGSVVPNTWYVNKTGLQVDLEEGALICIWWMAGKPSGAANGDQTTRCIAIQKASNLDGSKQASVYESEPGCVNVANYDECFVEAGSYYISNWPTDSNGGNNYIYKIEVIVPSVAE